MNGVNLPDIVHRVIRVLATDDDATATDTFLSVAALTLISITVAPMVASVLPVVAGLAAPLTAGTLAVIVRRLS